MNKKLIFRILGALASALIIVSVFVPFINVTGYSVSLWESFESTNSLYLPIMIIVFGAIGVIFFSLNIKTEFAYMSTGALIFFLVIETIDIINQEVFNTLGVGYYFLIVGTLLTGIMAFLTNLKSNKKSKTEKEEVVTTNETSMLNKIDKLYEEQESIQQNEISPIQPIDNVVEPIPVQPIDNTNIEQQSVEVNQISPQLPANNNLEEVNQPITVQQPVEQQTTIPSVPLEQPVPQNPVVQEFSNQPVQQNPVVQEFSNQPVQQNPIVQEFNQVSVPNPVVQEFSNVTENQNTILQTPIQEQPVVQQQENIQPEVTNVPLSNINENPVVQEFSNPGSSVGTQQNTNDLDIFGQPINK